MITKRKFSSYGPVDKSIEYYAPREELVQKAIMQLRGENPEKGGHYFTVWAPRQAGKSWSLREALWRLQQDDRFYTVKVNLQLGFMEALPVAQYIVEQINMYLKLGIVIPNTLKEFQEIFKNGNTKKPFILILDEFDDLSPEAIAEMIKVFRNIYTTRKDTSKSAFEWEYLLHGIALIGVRSVLGIENPKGSPFNVQRSLYIPNLTFDEVKLMFEDYQLEWGQQIDDEVIEKLYYETNGQPGLVSWFGELMCEKYNETPEKPLKMIDWLNTFSRASHIEPNNTVMNLISKANQPEHKETVLQLFKIDEKMLFDFENPAINFLYMNGVITFEETLDENEVNMQYAKFSCPFVQKRLFSRFCREYANYIGRTHDPLLELDDIFLETELNVYPLLKLYEAYLSKNKHWVNKDLPLRTDGHFYETFYHFNFFRWLFDIIHRREGYVIPEFPTGNGKIDIIITYCGKKYALELKSFSDSSDIKRHVGKAALYGQQLKLKQVYLIYFYDFVLPKERLEKYETQVLDVTTGVLVKPVFLYLDR